MDATTPPLALWFPPLSFDAERCRMALGSFGRGEGGSASEAIVNVGIAYDLQSDYRLSPEDPDDLLDEYDAPETIDAIEDALRSHGLTTHRLGGGERRSEEH